MISIDYFGRSGNQIFQWVFARLLAEKNGLGIITDPPKFHYPLKPAIPGKLNMHIGQTVLSDIRDQSQFYVCEDSDLSEGNIRLHGYFQHASYYNSHRKKIKEYFELPKLNTNYDDIVVHLRLTDYWWYRVRSVINPTWYFDILKNQKFRNLYVVAENHYTSKKYFDYFRSKYRNVKFIHGTPESDFEFIRNFDRIICSNSTYCWWSAFLSDATNVWTFKKWMRNATVPLAHMVNAEVVDGAYYNDNYLAKLDWEDYWKKEVLSVKL